MATETTNYQCPNCAGPLHFAGASGKLECDYCGSSYPVAEIEALYAEKEKKANAAQAEADKKREAAQGQDGWDSSELGTDWGEDGEKMRAYSCPSCGAELICDENTAATSCPYCGNPTVVPGKFSGSLRPDFIIPFKLSQEDAKKALREHYKGKRLLPKAFTQENKINEIKGVYVPFWMFDGKADADVSMAAEKINSRTEGDYRVTTTRHYDVHRSGTVEFEKIPVDAASKMPDDYMDAIEPFDYKTLCGFSTAYLPGFLADKYDVTTEDCAKRAQDRMENSALAKMQGDVSGYDSCIVTDKHVRLYKGKVHYAMLPVYMLNTRWKDQQYLFAMNGQTGKMVSKLPISWGKFFAWFAGITLSLGTALGTALYFFL